MTAVTWRCVRFKDAPVKFIAYSARDHKAPQLLMCLNPNLLEASNDEPNNLDSFRSFADERCKRRAHCVLGAATNSIGSNRAGLRFSLSRR